MNRPDPQKRKRSHSDEIESETKEVQVGLEPPKKRPSQQGKDEGIPPTQSQRVSLEQRRIEARRTSNRRSAQRSRLRHKTVIKEQEMTIQKLEADKALLQRINNDLSLKLDAALYQQHQLMRRMEHEEKVALDRNLALQRALIVRRIEDRTQHLPNDFFTNITSPLVHLTGAAGAQSLQSLRHSLPVVESGQNLVSNGIHDRPISDTARNPRIDTTAYISMLLSHPPPVPQSGQGEESPPSATSAQGGVPDNVRIHRLQQEIKALKEKDQEMV